MSPWSDGDHAEAEQPKRDHRQTEPKPRLKNHDDLTIHAIAHIIATAATNNATNTTALGQSIGLRSPFAIGSSP